jgi:hypothetical protein
MQTARALALTALLVCATAVAQNSIAPGDIEVPLDTAAQNRLGVGSMTLQAAQAPEVVDAIARVLDIGALAQLQSEIDTAQAAADASSSEEKRVALLAADDQNVSRQVLETARAQAAADAARLQLAHQRLALEWGPGLASLGDAQRRSLVAQIAGGHAALLRVDPLQAGIQDGTAVSLRPDPAMPAVATENLGPAATTDAKMQSNGLLVLARSEGPTELRAGRVLAAEVASGRSLAGVVLPRSALVRIDGATWAYLRRGAELFLRREVTDSRVQNDGWFVTSGFAAGDEIVNEGAGSLLAVERSDETTDDED